MNCAKERRCSSHGTPPTTDTQRLDRCSPPHQDQAGTRTSKALQQFNAVTHACVHLGSDGYTRGRRRARGEGEREGGFLQVRRTASVTCIALAWAAWSGVAVHICIAYMHGSRTKARHAGKTARPHNCTPPCPIDDNGQKQLSSEEGGAGGARGVQGEDRSGARQREKIYHKVYKRTNNRNMTE